MPEGVTYRKVRSFKELPVQIHMQFICAVSESDRSPLEIRRAPGGIARANDSCRWPLFMKVFLNSLQVGLAPKVFTG